jgi:hypothetical protein
MTTNDRASIGGTAPGSTALIGDISRVALGVLRQAYRYAQDSGADLWDFAVEIDELYQTGLTISDLRWLVARRFAEHGQETSIYGSPRRTFRPAEGLFFEKTTCVILTRLGEAFVSRFLDAPATSSRPMQADEAAGLARDCPMNHAPSLSIDAPIKPSWDPSRRELSLGGHVIKRYRVRAQNQEALLTAFEEESWPQHIDDPLPGTRDIDPRIRLHDAINRLNRCQTHHLLRFRGDGTGTGLFWELRQSAV